MSTDVTTPNTKQMDLFSNRGRKSVSPPPLVQPVPVHAESTLLTSLWSYQNAMKASGLALDTVEGYAQDIKVLESHLGDKPVKNVSHSDLINFIAGMRDQHQEEKTIYRRSCALKHYFNWLIGEKIIKFNPAASLRVKRPVPKLTEILSQKECNMLLQATKGPAEFCWIIVLLDAGPKREEFLKLQLRDFDISQRYQPLVRLSAGNRTKERTVDLRPEFVPAFQEFEAGKDLTDDFCPHDERRINEWLGGLARRAEIQKNVSCSVLRDTCGARRVTQGQPVIEVMTVLGYAKTSMNEESETKYSELASKFRQMNR